VASNNSFMDRIQLTRLCGALAALIGATVLLGWVLQEPLLIQISGGFIGMVVNTAAALFLAGLCLLLPKSLAWIVPLRLGCGALLTFIGTLVFVENLLDVHLGVDWPSLHSSLDDTNPRPGRMAPNTSLGVITTGLLLLLSKLADTPRVLGLRRALALVLIIIGLTGLFGYFLKVELLYDLPGITRMALHTAFGVTFLGIGFWLDQHRAPAFGDMPEEGREIMPIAAVALSVVASVAAISVFSFMQNRVEHLTADSLKDQQRDHALYFASTIQLRTGRAATITTRPGALATLRKLMSNTDDQASRLAVQKVAQSYLPHGFTWVAFYQRGRLIAQAGKPIATPAMEISLHGDSKRELLWHDGYHLRTRLPMRDEIGDVGEVLSEQPLSVLTELAADANRRGETGELALCSLNTPQLNCFPQRFRPQPFSVPRAIDGKPLPMALAIGGKSGVAFSTDYRRHRVLAAYGPVQELGIGIVLKMDLAELYAPIREQLQIMLLVLTLVVGISLWLLQRRLRPLVRNLVESKRMAQASEARFYAASENSPDGFYILDSVRDERGRTVDFRFSYVNDAGARLISPLPRHRLLKQCVGELFPLIRSGGHIDRYRIVVETGVPLHEEFELTAPGTSVTWIAQHVVRLGDGVAVTARDISESKGVEGRLLYMAQNDVLTGLPNRALFNDRLEQAIKRAIRNHMKIALFYLDVDHFKKINDTYGHAGGDELLRCVADRLRCCVRNTDTVARLGGDEFTVILEELRSMDVAPAIAQKIIEAFRVPVVLDSNSVNVTVSVGIAGYDSDLEEEFAPEKLTEKADKALYEAKRGGRGRYWIYTADTEAAQTAGEDTGAVKSAR